MDHSSSWRLWPEWYPEYSSWPREEATQSVNTSSPERRDAWQGNKNSFYLIPSVSPSLSVSKWTTFKKEIDVAAAEALMTLCWCVGENETGWEVSLLGWKLLTSSQTLLTFLKLHCDPAHQPRKHWTFKHTGQAARWTLTQGQST